MRVEREESRLENKLLDEEIQVYMQSVWSGDLLFVVAFLVVPYLSVL